MLVHTVLFWLRRDLEDDAINAFRLGLESLKTIESTEAVYIGRPANTPARPVIDGSYDFCLTVLLADVAAHDAYQDHPRHHEFLEKFASYWQQVKIYDAA